MRAASSVSPRKDVVEDHDARPVGVALDVDEVAQRVLDEVHPVDERQRHAAPAERLERVGAVEVLVARLPEQRRARRQLGPKLGRRVDARTRRPGQREAVAVADADLEVGRRLEHLVHPAEEVQVLQARLRYPVWRHDEYLARCLVGPSDGRSVSIEAKERAQAEIVGVRVEDDAVAVIWRARAGRALLRRAFARGPPSGDGAEVTTLASLGDHRLRARLELAELAGAAADGVEVWDLWVALTPGAPFTSSRRTSRRDRQQEGGGRLSKSRGEA